MVKEVTGKVLPTSFQLHHCSHFSSSSYTQIVYYQNQNKTKTHKNNENKQHTKNPKHSDCTVSFKITSRGWDPAASFSPLLRQYSQNNVNGSLSQERDIGFSCMWRNYGTCYQDQTSYFKHIFILFTKSPKSVGRSEGCHYRKPYGMQTSKPELCIINIYRIQWYSLLSVYSSHVT